MLESKELPVTSECSDSQHYFGEVIAPGPIAYVLAAAMAKSRVVQLANNYRYHLTCTPFCCCRSARAAAVAWQSPPLWPCRRRRRCLHCHKFGYVRGKQSRAGRKDSEILRLLRAKMRASWKYICKSRSAFKSPEAQALSAFFLPSRPPYKRALRGQPPPFHAIIIA